MFRMYGNRVEILRYQVEYTENEEQQISYVVTEEEADDIAKHYNGVKTALEPSDDEWMDGMEVPDVPDTYTEAMRIYSLGEQEYKQQIENSHKHGVEQLRADIDFISIMTGVTL